MQTYNTTATIIENTFFAHRFIPHGISMYITTVYGTLFVNKLFALICGCSGIIHLITTMLHSQTYNKARILNTNVLMRVWQYVAKLLTYWESIVQPLAYVYSFQIHRLTSQDPLPCPSSARTSTSSPAVQ